MAVALIQVWNVIRATSDNKPIWIAQNLDYEPSSYYLKTNKSSSEDTSSNQHLREELSDIRLEIAEMRAELALLNQQNVDAANMVQHELVSRSDDIPKAGMEMQEMNTEIYSGSACWEKVIVRIARTKTSYRMNTGVYWKYTGNVLSDR